MGIIRRETLPEKTHGKKRYASNSFRPDAADTRKEASRSLQRAVALGRHYRHGKRERNRKGAALGSRGIIAQLFDTDVERSGI